MTAQPPVVACPGCGHKQPWNPANPSRPFCSEQCKNQDFVAWAHEEHAIPGSPDFDDVLTGDIELGLLQQQRDGMQ